MVTQINSPLTRYRVIILLTTTFCSKDFFDPNFFRISSFLGPKYLCTQYFSHPKLLDQKICWPKQKFWPEIFQTRTFSDPTLFQTQRFFRPKSFLDLTFSQSQNLSDPNLLCPKICLTQTSFWSNNLMDNFFLRLRQLLFEELKENLSVALLSSACF